MILHRRLFGNGAFYGFLLFNDPLLESDEHMLALLSLLESVVHCFLVIVLLFELHLFFFDSACFKFLLHLIHPLFNFSDFVVMMSLILFLELVVPNLQLLHFLLSFGDFKIQILLDCKTPPIAILNQHVPIHTVHFDQLFCLFVGLVIRAVLGPHGVQHFRAYFLDEQIVE